MRTSLGLLAALCLTACTSGSGGTTTTAGGSVTTGGSGGSIGGSTGTQTCLTTTCASNADCVNCGPGYLCGEPYTNMCCGDTGTPCGATTDCCSADCDADTGNCCAIFGGACATSADCCTGFVCDTATLHCNNPATTTSGNGGSVTGSGTTSGASTSVASTAGTSTAASTTSGGSNTTGTTGTTLGSGTATTSGATTGTTSGAAAAAFAFTWAFGVSQACEQANVAWVTVALNAGTPTVAPCRDLNGVEGVTLNAGLFSGAETTYVVTAYDGVLDSQIGQVSGSVLAPLQGATPVPVTLPLASGQSSALDLNWTFNGLSSTQAGIATLQVQVTDPKNPGQDVDLVLDGGVNGVSLPGFGSGFYPVTFTGSGLASYAGSANLAANGLTPAVLLADLPASSSGNTGNVVIDYSFNSQTCAAAGLDTVSLQLTTSNGTAIAGPVNMLCGDAGISYVFTGLPAPATDFLWLEGVAHGQAQQLANPQIVVTPGATATYPAIAEPPP